MELYYWNSEALRNYGFGHLISIANNIDEAKENVRAQFLREFEDRNPHLDFNDIEDHDTIQQKFEELEQDLAKEPIPINNKTILITGSD